MLYITISKDVNVSGYETHLAKSEDLINWEQYCTILRRNDKTDGTASSVQDMQPLWMLSLAKPTR